MKVGRDWAKGIAIWLTYLGSGWKGAEDFQVEFGSKVGKFGKTELNCQKASEVKRVRVGTIGIA